jgi:hypothetical protein
MLPLSVVLNQPLLHSALPHKSHRLLHSHQEQWLTGQRFSTYTYAPLWFTGLGERVILSCFAFWDKVSLLALLASNTHSSCLSLLSAKITGTHHHTQHPLFFNCTTLTTFPCPNSLYLFPCVFQDSRTVRSSHLPESKTIWRTYGFSLIQSI